MGIKKSQHNNKDNQSKTQLISWKEMSSIYMNDQ
jgi:hypothetical protein